MNIEDELEKINKMTHAELCWLYRFAELGHPYFQRQNEQLAEAFITRFNSFGGMTTLMSKQIGWEK